MNIAGGYDLHTLILNMIKYIQNSQNLKSEKNTAWDKHERTKVVYD